MKLPKKHDTWLPGPPNGNYKCGDCAHCDSTTNTKVFIPLNEYSEAVKGHITPVPSRGIYGQVLVLSNFLWFLLSASKPDWKMPNRSKIPLRRCPGNCSILLPTQRAPDHRDFGTHSSTYTHIHVCANTRPDTHTHTHGWTHRVHTPLSPPLWPALVFGFQGVGSKWPLSL